MSISVVSSNVGIVARDSAMRRAISPWMRVSSSTVTSPFAVPVSEIDAGGGGGVAEGARTARLPEG